MAILLKTEVWSDVPTMALLDDIYKLGGLNTILISSTTFAQFLLIVKML